MSLNPPPRFLSAIQPSGQLHLGNYFGAIASHVANDGLYFIADYHALTTLRHAATLRKNRWEAAATYLAAGLNPIRSTLFVQSTVPETTELMWLLTTVSGVGLLERCPAYKEKRISGQSAEAGLLMYPVLMAADILLYDADRVPVGRDQLPHLDVVSDLAHSFNARYGPVFRVPEPIVGEAPVVPGIDGLKMSKSRGNTIPVTASPDEIAARVKSVKTDSTPLGSPLDPDTCTLFALYRLAAPPAAVAEMETKYRTGAIGYGGAKKALTEALVERFAPLREEYRRLEADPGYVDLTLAEGAMRARLIAREVLNRARFACGID
jgi:tryptophanyl-tRNA synthetase